MGWGFESLAGHQPKTICLPVTLCGTSHNFDDSQNGFAALAQRTEQRASTPLAAGSSPACRAVPGPRLPASLTKRGPCSAGQRPGNYLPLSSSGPGRRPLTPVTPVRSRSGVRHHRLAAQDTALSRRRHGFEPRWWRTVQEPARSCAARQRNLTNLVVLVALPGSNT